MYLSWINWLSPHLESGKQAVNTTFTYYFMSMAANRSHPAETGQYQDSSGVMFHGESWRASLIFTLKPMCGSLAAQFPHCIHQLVSNFVCTLVLSRWPQSTEQDSYLDLSHNGDVCFLFAFLFVNKERKEIWWVQILQHPPTPTCRQSTETLQFGKWEAEVEARLSAWACFQKVVLPWILGTAAKNLQKRK